MTKSAKKVAYLGIKGAYSERAAAQHFGKDMQDVQCSNFADILALVESGQVDHGILPIENSLAGTVSQSYELLTDHDVKIQGEVILKIEHALLALPGTKLEDLKQVRSHPQALAQCADFLKAHNLEPVSWYNTAGSAKDLAADPVAGVGAIAGADVAEMYGLDVLATNIQDIAENYTRFFVLGRGEVAPAEHNKTSLIFTTKHKPGALVACLQCFAGRDINLTKLESRPLRDRPWEYIFYMDFEGHTEDANFQAAFDDLQEHTAFVRVLGSYPAAIMPVAEQK
jgi:prephenate dehydratase